MPTLLEQERPGDILKCLNCGEIVDDVILRNRIHPVRYRDIRARLEKVFILN